MYIYLLLSKGRRLKKKRNPERQGKEKEGDIGPVFLESISWKMTLEEEENTRSFSLSLSLSMVKTHKMHQKNMVTLDFPSPETTG